MMRMMMTMIATMMMMSSGQGIKNLLLIVAMDDQLPLDILSLEAKFLKPLPQLQEG